MNAAEFFLALLPLIAMLAGFAVGFRIGQINPAHTSEAEPETHGDWGGCPIEARLTDYQREWVRGITRRAEDMPRDWSL